MKLPIILVDGNDVDVYLSKEELICDIEPIDVRNNTFKAYDSGGCSLRLLVDNDDIISIEHLKDSLCDAAKLKNIIALYISYVLDKEASLDIPLKELIEQLLVILKKAE